MTKAELWLKSSLDTEGRLGGRGLYLLQQCPPVGKKMGFSWFLLDLPLDRCTLQIISTSQTCFSSVSDQFCWLEKDLANIVSTCEIVWSLFKKIRSISDISDTWLEEWNTFFFITYYIQNRRVYPPTIFITTLNLMQTRLLQLLL